jgi:hypothetical protein
MAAGSCWELLGAVGELLGAGSCWELLGSCWVLGAVGELMGAQCALPQSLQNKAGDG